MSKQKLVVILGPTGCGKTALALELAKQYNGEIVNADSRALYRGFDIGTAKPAPAERGSVAHHLIDILEGNEDFSAAQFKERAEAAIADIGSRGRLPILVGGTMQYVSAVVENWNIPAVPPREELRKQLQQLPLEELQDRLEHLDPESFDVIDTSNPRRVVRALEVVIATGKSFVAQRTKAEPLFETLVLGIDSERGELCRRLDERVTRMMAQGLLKEVEQMSERYGWDAPGMSSIGYREWKNYFEAGCGAWERRADTCAALERDALKRIQRDNRVYVRKQIAWFKKMKDVVWISEKAHARQLLEKFV